MSSLTLSNGTKAATKNGTRQASEKMTVMGDSLGLILESMKD